MALLLYCLEGESSKRLPLLGPQVILSMVHIIYKSGNRFVLSDKPDRCFFERRFIWTLYSLLESDLIFQ